MKILTHLLTLAILMGGLSLHAMDDATQLKALETALQAINAQHDELDKEFRHWNTTTLEEERELEPRFQWLWEELPKVKSQQEALQAQINQKKEAAQLKTLEDELEEQNRIQNLICEELLEYGPSGQGLIAGSDLHKAHFQKRQNDLEEVRLRADQLKEQIKQKKDAIAQKYPTPSRPHTPLTGIWFRNGTSYESGKK